ncbi:MAG: hypothetical protein RLN72_03675, partial [Henriciella sp.]
GDRELLKYFTERFAAEGYKFPNLLRAIVLSDAFANVKPIQTEETQESAENAGAPRTQQIAAHQSN